MDTLQQLATIILAVIAIYIVYVLLTKKNAIPTQGLMAKPTFTGVNALKDVSNPELRESKGSPKGSVPPGGFQTSPASAMFNPDANGILPYNHDKFEQKAEFQSDVTNMNQFYKNNPELFEKHKMDLSWSDQSNAMHQSHVNSQSAWIGPSNQDVTIGSPLT
jgi:hypothetical protein